MYSDLNQQIIESSPFSPLIRGNRNLINYYITVYKNEGESTALLVSQTLKSYLKHIRTDKSRLQIEYILIHADRVFFSGVPLPKVFTQLRVVFKEGKSSSIKSKRQTVFPAIRAIADNKHIVVIGDPGSGKTTLLNYLAILMARLVDQEVDSESKEEMEFRLNEDTKLEDDEVKGWKDKYYFPISISLLEFSLSPEFSKGEGNSSNLVNFILRKICEQYGEIDNDAVTKSIIEMLRLGNTIILLDGLDHLPSPIGGVASDFVARDRNRLKRILNSFTTAEGYSQNRVVVTSRRYAYNNDVEWRLDSHFSTAELQPFENDQITKFINYWHEEIVKVERNKEGKSEEDISESEKEQLEIAVRKYIDEVINTPYMRALAQTPLLLTYMVCRYHPLRGAQSVSRLQLYDEIIRLLVERWARHAENDGGDNLAKKLRLQNDDELIKVLSIVSFEAQAQSLQANQHAAIITEKTLKDAWTKFIKSEGRMIAIEQDSPVWEELKMRNGILLPAQTFMGEDKVQYERFEFPHQSLREALAAKAVFSETKEFFPEQWLENYLGITETLNAEELVLGMLNHSWEAWLPVCQLVLEDAGKTGRSRLEKIIVHFDPLESKTNYPSRYSENGRWYGALLAGEHFARFNPESKLPIVDTVKNWLAEALRRQAVNIDYRHSAGQYLSVLGDPRVDLGNSAVWSLETANTNESIWSLIPAKDITVAGNKKTGRVKTKSFYASRYLITNSQFNAFVAEGYKDEKYWKWSEDALNYWDSTQKYLAINTDVQNAPVVNVSWFSAVSFCKWLSEKIGFSVMLPTEIQWLSYSDYNMQSDFDEDSDALTKKFNIRSSSTCTVGIYPPTDAGVYDVLGNAAEWTASKWKTEVNSLEGEAGNLSGSDLTKRVIRGASFKDWNPKIGKRESGKQGEKFYFVGFRIVAQLD